MLESEHEAFDKILAELFAAIDKPLGEAQRTAFWRGLSRMSLAEFSRCRDKILADLAGGESPRKFGVSDIWVAKSKLQAFAPSKPRDDGFLGDDWDAAANRHLLAYIGKRLSTSSMAYGEGPSYEGMADPARAHLANADADPKFITNVHTLVAYKNRWADMMRAAADQDGVPIDEQQEIWTECMRLAEVDIAA